MKNKTLSKQLKFIVDYANAGVSVRDYGIYFMSNTTYEEKKNAR